MGLLLAAVAAAGLGACRRDRAGEARELRGPALAEHDLRRKFARNRLAYIPPQCFTRVKDSPESTPQNPCYVCHAGAREPNQQSQPELQLAYDFPEPQAGHVAENPWSNLFADRRVALRAISDEAVLAYVARDNYRAGGALAERLAHVPASWDADGNGRWDGYVPDAYFAFDPAGFDHAPDGRATGWRTFAYYPLPGAFMPANGSFDDVLVRLPEAFRRDERGALNLQVYALNFAIVEALIQRRDVEIAPTDERAVNVDLDGDGVLGRAKRVAFRFRPGVAASMQYVGRARVEQAAGKRALAPGLFPEGTEFLHSVRYVALDGERRPKPSPRMKELRYARKHHFKSYSDLMDKAQREAKEAVLNPDRPEQFLGDAERGLSTPLGWVYQGFIEDKTGELRPQDYEETLSCMGCHSGLSATDDGVFSFARKLAHGERGWSEHGYVNRALPDPTREDGAPEFATYLRHNRAGDEFRENDELLRAFFDEHGRERPEAFAELARDVRTLLLPSPERALALDKAYWLLVQEQSFARGRHALLAPAKNVLRSVRAGEPTGVTEALPARKLGVALRDGVRVARP